LDEQAIVASDGKQIGKSPEVLADFYIAVPMLHNGDEIALRAQEL